MAYPFAGPPDPGGAEESPAEPAAAAAEPGTAGLGPAQPAPPEASTIEAGPAELASPEAALTGATAITPPPVPSPASPTSPTSAYPTAATDAQPAAFAPASVPRRARPRFVTIFWGVVLLAFAAFMAVMTLLPHPADLTLWLLGGVIGIGVLLITVGVIAASRRAG
jgi:hypothetical protein